VVEVTEFIEGPIFRFRIVPPVVFQNLLPMRIAFNFEKVEGDWKLSKGQESKKTKFNFYCFSLIFIYYY